jgi:hypothetical protein
MIGREIFLILLVLSLTAVLFAWYRAARCKSRPM